MNLPGFGVQSIRIYTSNQAYPIRNKYGVAIFIVPAYANMHVDLMWSDELDDWTLVGYRSADSYCAFCQKSFWLDELQTHYKSEHPQEYKMKAFW